MANTEYQYEIKFIITHPHLSVSDISQSFDGLEATRSVSVGEFYRAGRTAKISVWEVEFFKSRLTADEIPLEVKLNSMIDTLCPFTNAIHTLAQEGTATCEVTIFSQSECSVCLFSAESMAKLGKIGVDLVLTFYDREELKEKNLKRT